VPELAYELEQQVGDRIVKAIQLKKPEWTLQTGVCIPCMNHFQNMVTKPSHFKRLRGRLLDLLAREHHREQDAVR